MSQCPNCKAEVADGVKFCTKCGTAIVKEEKIQCPKCSSMLAAGVKFCTVCGTSLQENAAPATPKTEPVAPVTQPTPVPQPVSAVQSAPASKPSAPVPPNAKKSGKGLFVLLGGICAAIVVVAAVLLYFLVLAGSPLDDYYQDKYEYSYITDTRDNQKYRTIRVGSQVWMVQNANYRTSSSVCDSCNVYGQYYTWQDAAMACPAGFVLPTKADFEELKMTAGHASVIQSIKGWLSGQSGSDDLGFAAIPSGYYDFRDGIVKNRFDAAKYWSNVGAGRFALYMNVNGVDNTLGLSGAEKNYGYSVRCISEETSNRMMRTNDVVIDVRDGSFYEVVDIQGQKWLAQNANLKTNSSVCSENDDVDCSKYGRLYTWQEALTVCPEGTRLPNVDDVDKLKKPLASKISVFKPAYAGFRNVKGKFELAGTRADMWLASEDNTNGKYWFLSSSGSKLNTSKFSKKAMMSVRCIAEPLNIEVVEGTFYDYRDSHEYKTVRIGNQTWMAENLNYDVSGSFCYKNSSSNCRTYGRLYVYDDAVEVCPSGWSLPNDDDWQTLKNYVSDHGNGDLASMLKSRDLWTEPGEDLFGFHMVPSGYRSEKGKFDRLKERAYLWSDTEVSWDSATHWAVTNGSRTFEKTKVYKENARAVRCIRNY